MDDSCGFCMYAYEKLMYQLHSARRKDGLSTLTPPESSCIVDCELEFLVDTLCELAEERKQRLQKEAANDG